MLAHSNWSAGTTGRIPRQEHVEGLVVHERAMLDAVEAGAERVLDALGCAAMPGDLAVIVVGLGHHRRHLLEGHAQRVMVGGVGRGGIAGGVGLDPLHPILHQLADGGAGLDGPLTRRISPSMPSFRCSAFQSISPPAPQISRPLAARRGPGNKVFLDRLLEPDVDVVQAAPAPRRGVAALEGQPSIGGRQQRDILDRILDIEIRELGHVEIRGVEMGLDQPGHDRPAAGVDPPASGGTSGTPAAGPA